MSALTSSSSNGHRSSLIGTNPQFMDIVENVLTPDTRKKYDDKIKNLGKWLKLKGITHNSAIVDLVTNIQAEPLPTFTETECIDPITGKNKGAVITVNVPLDENILVSYIESVLHLPSGKLKAHDTIDGYICAIEYLYRCRGLVFSQSLQLILKEFNKGNNYCCLVFYLFLFNNIFI